MATFNIVDLIFRIKDDSSKGLKSLNKNMKSMVSGLKKLRNGALAVGAATGAMALAIQKSVKAVDLLAKTARRIDFDVENLQELGFVAEQAGIEFREFTLGLQRFERRLAEVASTGSGEFVKALEIFAAEGIDFDINLAPSEDNADRFARFLDAVNQLDDGGQRLLVSFKAFDSEGAKIGVNMAQTAAEFANARKEARALGVVLDRDLIARTEEFNNQLNAAGTSIKVSFQSAMVALAPTLVDGTRHLAAFAQTLAGMLPDFKEFERLQPEQIADNIPEAVERLNELNKELVLARVARDDFLKAGAGAILEVGPLEANVVSLQGKFDKLQASINTARDNLDDASTAAEKFDKALAARSATAYVTILDRLTRETIAFNEALSGGSEINAARRNADKALAADLKSIGLAKLQDEENVNGLQEAARDKHTASLQAAEFAHAEAVRTIRFDASAALLSQNERALAEETFAIEEEYKARRGIVGDNEKDLSALVLAERAELLRARKEFNEAETDQIKDFVRQSRDLRRTAFSADLSEAQRAYNADVAALRDRFEESGQLVAAGYLTQLNHRRAFQVELEQLNQQHKESANAFAFDLKETVGEAFVTLGNTATSTLTQLILGQKSASEAAKELGASILASMVRVPVEGFIKNIFSSFGVGQSPLVVESTAFVGGVDRFGNFVTIFSAAANQLAIGGGLQGPVSGAVGGFSPLGPVQRGPNKFLGTADTKPFSGVLLQSANTFDDASTLSFLGGLEQVSAAKSMTLSSGQFTSAAGTMLNAASLFSSVAGGKAGAAIGIVGTLFSLLAGGTPVAAHGGEVTQSGLVNVHAGEVIYAAGSPGSRSRGSGVQISQTIIYTNDRLQSQEVTAQGGTQEDRDYFAAQVMGIMDEELRPGGRLFREG